MVIQIGIRRERRIFMAKEKDKLIDEIGELALQNDMNYIG
jgi:hypothetical protein